MTGIPTINFDYFNLAEIPTFILCNPNKERLYALGGISERKYFPRYNAISELSFRADQYIDGNLMPYYQYITNRRLVYLDGIGYFMITEVTENNDGIVKYKEVGCQSLEVELSSRKLTGFVSGSGIYDENGTLVSLNPVPLTMTQFYSEILPYLGGWTFDIIPETLDEKYRSFDVSDTTIYNLLMVDVEEAYECIFDFDTSNNIIYIYDANTDIETTDIFISHDNVIKSMTVEEVTDELATCLYVVGGGDLGIYHVNPLGNNYIYNFQYFKSTDWMEQSLIDSIDIWETKFLNETSGYFSEVLEYFADYDDKTAHEAELNIISGSYLHADRLYEYLVESGCSVADPYMIALNNERIALANERDAVQAEIYVIDNYINGHLDTIDEISTSLRLDNTVNFSTSQQRQLQPFIIQSSYVNDNIIEIDGMTSEQLIMQQQSLYGQGLSVLEKISMPRYSFEIDSVSFLQIKDFQTFGSQLELGKKITLEIEPGRYLQPILLGADIDFDNPTNFKLIFGNRLRLNDETYQFNDLMNKALSAGTSMNLNSQAFNNWTRDYKSGYLNLITGISVGGTEPAEKIDITPGIMNLKTDKLQWNGVDLAFGWGTGTGGLTNIKITLFSGGISVAMYDPTHAGLDDAIEDSQSGDIIFIPDVEITGDFMIPQGVTLTGLGSNSIIKGTVTLGGDESSITNISIEAESTIDSVEDDIAAIIGPSTGDGFINDCIINATSFSGSAFGIMLSNGNLTVRNSKCSSATLGYGKSISVYSPSETSGSCYINNVIAVATSTSGSGYAYMADGTGNMYVYDGYTEAITAPVGV